MGSHYSRYEKQDFKIYKRYAIRAAKELLYDDKVIKKIEAANTSGEISRIMLQARNDMNYDSAI